MRLRFCSLLVKDSSLRVIAVCSIEHLLELLGSKVRYGRLTCVGYLAGLLYVGGTPSSCAITKSFLDISVKDMATEI